MCSVSRLLWLCCLFFANINVNSYKKWQTLTGLRQCCLQRLAVWDRPTVFTFWQQPIAISICQSVSSQAASENRSTLCGLWACGVFILPAHQASQQHLCRSSPSSRRTHMHLHANSHSIVNVISHSLTGYVFSASTTAAHSALTPLAGKHKWASDL